jgi:hypothetical protein
MRRLFASLLDFSRLVMNIARIDLMERDLGHLFVRHATHFGS